MKKKINGLVALTVLTGAAANSAYGAFVTVATYDSLSNANQVDTTAAGSNVTLAQFTADVAAAHAANTGGVIDFDTVDTAGNPLPTTDPGALSFPAVYGVSASNTLTVSRINQAPPATATSGVNINTASAISGTNALGFSGSGTFTLSFNQALTEVGFTALSRGDARTADFSVTLDNGSVVPVSSQQLVGSQTVNGVTVTTGDVFFGYAAPSDRTISAINFTPSAFLRIDDLGFVAVPEPTTLGLLGVGALGLLARRRRSI